MIAYKREFDNIKLCNKVVSERDLIDSIKASV